MDMALAAFRFVERHKATLLAPVLGKHPATLSNEANPNYPTAKLGLVDAVLLSKWTNDLELLNTFGAEMRCMIVPLAADVPGVEGIGPRTAVLAQEFADLMGRVANDLADGQVSANDVSGIEREASELMAALQALLAAVRAMHDAARPADGAGAPPLRRVG